MISCPLDQESWIRISLWILIQEAKILRIQRIRTRILYTAYIHTSYLERYINRSNVYLQVEERKICEVCSKVCLTIGNLNVHMRTHCLDKPFSCKLCDKTFKWNSSLNTHIQSAHSKQGFFKEINFKLFIFL